MNTARDIRESRDMGENVVVWVLAAIEVTAVGAAIAAVRRQARRRRRGAASR